MTNKIKVVGLVGSLRQASVTRQLCELAASFLDEDMDFEMLDISEVPLFNAELESIEPQAVTELKNKVYASDALLISTPEYNNGIPGVLKNVLDWLSRPMVGHDTIVKPLAGKAAFIIGGGDGMSGAINAQEHLRSILAYMNVFVLPSQRATIPFLGRNTKDGKLELNEMSQQFLKEGVQGFSRYIKAFVQD